MTPQPYNLSLSQWFTPPDLAKRIVEWAGVKPGMRVLEPSAGNGSFVRELLGIKDVLVDAVEIDTRWRTRNHAPAGLIWFTADFFEWVETGYVDDPYDLAILNPPYENGQDLKFIQACAEISETTIALTKTSFFHGVERGGKFWKHWRPTRLVFLSSRPKFSSSKGSPKTDFCVFEIKRSDPKPESTKIEWWP